MVVPRVNFAGQSIPAYAKTVGRAVHVKIHPQPRNLAESRDVLRVLRQYGEVVMFKHLKHEPNLRAANTALAIYQNTTSAQRIIDASPLRFESGSAESSSSVSQFMTSTSPSGEEEEGSGPAPEDEPDSALEEFDEVNTPRQRPNEAPGGATTITGLSGTIRAGSTRSSANTHQAATNPTPSQPPKKSNPNSTALEDSFTDLSDPDSATQQTSKSSDTPREFHLVIERSVLNHHAYIQRQHYYGGFQLNLKSLMGEDLEGRVPVAGMADCQLGKPEVPLRVRLKRREEEDKKVRTSLGSLWQEGARAREKEAAEKAGIDNSGY